MALPKIKINYLNGQLGTVGESADGLLAIVCGQNAVGSTFAQNVGYEIYKLADLEKLGVKSGALHEHVEAFYNEAEEGTKLIVMGVDDTATTSALLSKSDGAVKSLLSQMNGKLRGVFVEGTTNDKSAIDAALPVAQSLAEWSTETMYAPLFICLGAEYDGGLSDLTEKEYDRVMVLVGDSMEDSMTACLGTLAGRIASIPVQRNIGRVRDGALYEPEMYIGEEAAELMESAATSLHDKGYVTIRSYVGKSGYYFTDDCMACKKTGDYAHLTARRTVDKAYRIAYATLLDYMLDEIEVNDNGTMQPAILKSWQQSVENAINREMTAQGELSAVDGSGCSCYIDESQNVVATSKIEMTLRVRPFGYARDIVVNLGFLVTNE